MSKHRSPEEVMEELVYPNPGWELAKVFFGLLLGLGIPGLGMFALMMWASSTFV